MGPAVEAKDQGVEGLPPLELPGVPYQGGPNHLVPGDQPGQVALPHKDRVEGKRGLKVKDTHPSGLLFHQLPDHLREQVGRRVDSQVLLPGPLLAEEVVPLGLDLRRLAVVPRYYSVEPGGEDADGELLPLEHPGHGVEVQLKLLQPTPGAPAAPVSYYHLLLTPPLPDKVKSEALPLAGQVDLHR